MTDSANTDAADLYQRVVMDRGRNPRHRGDPSHTEATGQGDNPMCGDRVSVGLCYNADGAVKDAVFEAHGCMISLASADLMAEIAIGQTPAALRGLYPDVERMMRSGDCPDGALQVLQPLAGVHAYPSRIGCATLPWRALIAALDQEPHHHG